MAAENGHGSQGRSFHDAQKHEEQDKETDAA